jgi:hypothetical protein
LDYIHASLRIIFVNNDKKLPAIRRNNNAKFHLYNCWTSYPVYSRHNTRMGGFKNSWTTQISVSSVLLISLLSDNHWPQQPSNGAAKSTIPLAGSWGIRTFA